MNVSAIARGKAGICRLRRRLRLHAGHAHRLSPSVWLCGPVDLARRAMLVLWLQARPCLSPRTMDRDERNATDSARRRRPAYRRCVRWRGVGCLACPRGWLLGPGTAGLGGSGSEWGSGRAGGGWGLELGRWAGGKQGRREEGGGKESHARLNELNMRLRRDCAGTLGPSASRVESGSAGARVARSERRTWLETWLWRRWAGVGLRHGRLALLWICGTGED